MRLAAKFLGFLLIFFVVVLVGAILAFLLSKLMKGTIQVVNHFLGGVFGCLGGIADRRGARLRPARFSGRPDGRLRIAARALLLRR